LAVFLGASSGTGFTANGFALSGLSLRPRLVCLSSWCFAQEPFCWPNAFEFFVGAFEIAFGLRLIAAEVWIQWRSEGRQPREKFMIDGLKIVFRWRKATALA
jgi:hypothetical protein